MRFVHSEDAVKKIERDAIFMLAILIVMYLLFPLRACGQSSATPGTLEGTVFVVDSGGPSLLPGARVVLKGSTNRETETDAERFRLLRRWLRPSSAERPLARRSPSACITCHYPLIGAAARNASSGAHFGFSPKKQLLTACESGRTVIS